MADGPGDALAWLGLGIALVAASSFGLADPIRWTLYAVILYVLLVNAERIAPALDRLNRALADRRASSPGGAGGARLLLR